MDLNMIQFRDTAASKLPEQESSSRYFPPEIVGEIFLNLPVKSLLRFSTVSKSWNFMIHSDQRFISKHRSRAALSGGERIFKSQSTTAAATLPLSSLLSNQAAANTTPLIIPFKIEEISDISLLASCGELWCVVYEGSIFLWNPSMGTFKKLPDPSHLLPALELSEILSLGIGFDFDYGIGYDAVADDYKILKMRKGISPELYSLRSNSWKAIPFFTLHRNCDVSIACASGVFYWVDYVHVDHVHDDAWSQGVIVSFDLSTEKYAEVPPPPYDPVNFDDGDLMTLSVIKGKLCLHVQYNCRKKYVLWGREDCKWRKMLDFTWRLDEGEEVENTKMAVLCQDNGKILIDAKIGNSRRIYMCMAGKREPQVVSRCNYDDGLSGELYVESLVSPATYCSRPCPPETHPTHGVVDGCNQP